MNQNSPGQSRQSGTRKRKRPSASSHSNAWGTHPVIAHLLGCLLIVMTVGCGYSLLLEPLAVEYESIAEESSRIEQLVASMGSLRETAGRLETQFAQDVSRVHGKYLQIPGSDPFDQFVVDLSMLATRSGTMIESVQPVGTQSRGTAEFQVVEVQLRSNFAGLCRFLEECKYYSTPVWVTSLDTQVKAGSSNRTRGELENTRLMIQLPFQFHAEMTRRLKTHVDSVSSNTQEA